MKRLSSTDLPKGHRIDERDIEVEVEGYPQVAQVFKRLGISASIQEAMQSNLPRPSFKYPNAT
jgi:hypothetical protein